MKRPPARPSQTLTLLLATIAVVACGSVNPDRLTGSDGCALKEQLNARLHVDPDDERYIWATDVATEAVSGCRDIIQSAFMIDEGDIRPEP